MLCAQLHSCPCVQFYAIRLGVIQVMCRSSQDYYRKYARENFVTWNDESDPEKIKMLLDKAPADAEWVLQKVRILDMRE